jgi:hypothetical protein
MSLMRGTLGGIPTLRLAALSSTRMRGSQLSVHTTAMATHGWRTGPASPAREACPAVPLETTPCALDTTRWRPSWQRQALATGVKKSLMPHAMRTQCRQQQRA